MLTLTWFELLAGVIPENLLFFYGICRLSNIQINLKKLLLSTVIASIFTYSIRLLPIQFGVHTLVLIIIFILMSVYLIRVDIAKAITSVLLMFIIRLITEWINIFALQEILKINIDTLFSDSTKKVIYTLPSLFLFFLAAHFISTLKNKKWKKDS